MCLNGEIFEEFPGEKGIIEEEKKIEEQYSKYVDHIMKIEGIELEKCSGKKIKIGKVNENDIFIYKISKKYIKKNSAEIFIYIGGKRKNSYRISFEYNIGKMITGDYGEENNKRIEHSRSFCNRILIQDKKTKLWKNMGNKNREFNKELDEIIKLIKIEYLNPELNK